MAAVSTTASAATVTPLQPAPTTIDADMPPDAVVVPKRSREEVEQAAFESINMARRMDGLPPLKRTATEWNRVNDPDVDILNSEDEEAFLLFDDEDDEQIYMVTKRATCPDNHRG